MNDGAGALVVTSEEFAEQRRGLEVLGDDRRAGLRRRRVRLPGPNAREGGQHRAREGRQDDRRRRAGRDQRGVLVGRAQLGCELLGADPETVNVNGGAVALGHPIGASGRADPRDDDPRAAPQRRRARARGDLLRRRPGRRNSAGGLTCASSTSWSSAPARWAAASRRSSPPRAGTRLAPRLARPVRSSAGSRRCEKSLDAGSPRRAGADPDEVLGARHAGRRARRRRPDDRGGRRGRGGEGGRSSARADEMLPPRRSSPRTRRRSRSASLAAATGAARPRDRDALLQPGAGAEARRGRPRAARPPTRRPQAIVELARGARQDAGRARTTSRASSRTGS